MWSCNVGYRNTDTERGGCGYAERMWGIRDASILYMQITSLDFWYFVYILTALKQYKYTKLTKLCGNKDITNEPFGNDVFLFYA